MIIPPSGITRQAMPEAVSAPIHTSMPAPTFHDWLRNRPDKPPQADRLATIIAQAGAADVSLDGLRKVVGLSPETLQDVLRALTATGQVVMKTVSPRYRCPRAGAPTSNPLLSM